LRTATRAALSTVGIRLIERRSPTTSRATRCAFRWGDTQNFASLGLTAFAKRSYRRAIKARGLAQGSFDGMSDAMPYPELEAFFALPR